jgi:intracellular sulfur oxidation DsrE/DsrF family protein
VRAIHPHPAIHYWRDKSQREIEFVVAHPDALKAFRALYPRGANYLVCPLVSEPYTVRKGGLAVKVCGTTTAAVRVNP